jgi:hypothetical protein
VSEIYFIKCGDRIKIGFSRNTDGRMKELATGAPAQLVLLGRVPGSRRLEAALHRRLRNYRVLREWFIDCAEVREVMQKTIDSGDCSVGDTQYPELIEALKRIVGPIKIGTKTKEAINVASQRTGLPRWRTFDIWYGKARQVQVPEAILIRDALLRHIGR